MSTSTNTSSICSDVRNMVERFKNPKDHTLAPVYSTGILGHQSALDAFVNAHIATVQEQVKNLSLTLSSDKRHEQYCR